MSLYEGVAFQGTFRDYQQRILDHAEQYIAEGKLNIVMPPGSGKTILGLELIRRCRKACLIISPTVATRDHWGKRLGEYFLKEESRFQELFSTDLDQAKVINALTYEELEECMATAPCPRCQGNRLSEIARAVTVGGIGSKFITVSNQGKTYILQLDTAKTATKF